jgi:hypothetical protein
MKKDTRGISVMEHTRTPSRKFLLRRAQAFFHGIGITNTAPLQLNFGSLFAFWNLFQKKESID